MNNAARELTLVIAVVGFFFMVGIVAVVIFLRVMIKERRAQQNSELNREAKSREDVK